MPLWIDQKPLVLASKSGARRRILEAVGIPVDIRPAAINERAEEARAGAKTAEQAAHVLAQIKAAAVSALMPGRLVLSADQTLSLGDRRFSKPADRTAAREQLRALSGKTHRLYSAAVLMRDDTVLFDYGEAAELTMRELSDRFLEIYLDAAGEGATTSVGGYQIEATGAQLFGGVNGDYFTILGLPLLPLLDFLRRSGLIAA
jgi:septum formation protein